MAFSRDVRVNVIGDSRSLERAFARSTAATKRFGAQTDTTLGKVEGNFTRLQRIGAGGFVGGAIAAAGITALKKLVDVSAESQQVLGQTRVAVEATGKSWDRYGRIIEKTVDQQSRLGFDDEALLQTFSLFQRTVGDVGKSLTLNNLAMDVARARFIDLEQAAQLVNKAALGQAGALRRLGIDTQGATDPTRLLALLTEKYGGSAKAASKDARTSLDRVGVSVENLEESLGTLLLPAVELLADDLDAAARSASLLVDGLRKVGQVRIPKIEIPFLVTVGGQSVGDLARGGAGILKFTPLNPLFGLTIANEIANQFRDQTKPGSAASTQLANDFARSINLMTQNALDTAPVKTPKVALRPASEFAQLPGVKVDFASAILGPIDKAIDLAKKQSADAISKGRAAISKDAAEKAAQRRSDAFAGLIGTLGLGVDRAGLTRRLSDDLDALQDLKAGLQKQIRAGVDVSSAQSQLVSVLGQIADKQAQISAQQKDALQARQFRALGLTAAGDEPVPGIKNLAKRINQALRNNDLGKVDISSKLVSRLKAARKLIKTEGGKLTEDTRRVINDFLKAVTGQDAKTKTDGPLTKTSALNVGRILDGLGLSRDAEKELRSRLSSFNSAGLSLAGKPTTAATGKFVSPFVVQSNVTVTLDGDVVGRAVTRSQQKAGRRNPPQRRGPNARSGI